MKSFVHKISVEKANVCIVTISCKEDNRFLCSRGTRVTSTHVLLFTLTNEWWEGLHILKEITH